MRLLERPIRTDDGAPIAGTGGCTLCDCPQWLDDGREPAHCSGNNSEGQRCGHSENDHR